MNVLIACEFSGRVREAFRARGHNAWSCDLLPAEDASPYHYQTDVRDVIVSHRWELVIAHPPCTDLCRSGARWWPEKQASGSQQRAIEFFMEFTRLSCAVAIENPIGLMSTLYRKPDQIIQPWEHGHGEVKGSCLWLRDLPLLTPTNVVAGRSPNSHRSPDSKDRWKRRSRTLPGIAHAMAAQWG